jgi:hypothetical protein
MLADFLSRHDERCPVCAYNLRGLTQNVCPECSAPLALGVVSPNSAPWAWAAALIGFALAAGFDLVSTLLLSAFVIEEMVRLGPPPGIPEELVLLFATMILLGGGSVIGMSIMLTQRNPWQRRSVRRQWKLAIALIVGTGGIHLAAGVVLFAVLP